MLPLTATAVFLIGCSVSYTVGERISASLHDLRDRSYPHKEALDRLASAVDTFRTAVQDAAVEGDETKVEEAKVAAVSARKEIAALVAINGKDARTVDLKTWFDAYQPDAMRAALAMAGKGEAGGSIERMSEQKKALDKRIADMRSDAASAVQLSQEQAISGVRRILFVLICTGLVTLVALGVASRLILKSVWKDLGDEPSALRLRVQRIADGELREEVARDGAGDDRSLSGALGRMTGQLRETVAAIRTGADAIAGASSEISSGNQDLSVRTEQASASLQQTASAMEEITSTVSQTADTAIRAGDLAQRARDSALQGGEIMKGVVSNMAAIASASKQIGEIISVIDTLAFQTNILALNAAVEAARAGEQGRGFAVVAAEVRSLAQRSAGAAREIRTLIEGSTSRVEEGNYRVGDAGRAMQAIVTNVGSVFEAISEISLATSEQSRGIVNVNDSVSHLDKVTQQNAALVEECAAAAGGLQDQAAQLADAVRFFKT